MVFGPLGKSRQVSSQVLLLLLTGYFTLVFNWPFFLKIYSYLGSLEALTWSVALSLPLFLFAFVYLSLSVFVVKGLTKALMVPLILVSAAAAYASLHYGVVFDSGMIENLFETNVGEADSYLSFSYVASVLVLGVIPSLLLLRVRIHYQPFWRELWQRTAAFGLALAVLVGTLLLFYEDYVSVGRNNQYAEKLILPGEMLASVGSYLAKNREQEAERPFEVLGQDAHRVGASDKPVFMVVVLGETARAANYHYNGYSRDTNRYTEPLGLMSLGEVSSCGTATALSVPCMFSFMVRKDYDKAIALHQSNVLDVIHQAGVDVTWVDNNSSCKGVCGRVQYIKIDTSAADPLCDGEFCFDEVLLRHLDRMLAQPLKHDQLVVFHLIGSHGPTYYRRYPESRRVFTPDCPRSDIQNCSHQEIINTYDNTILYTDYVIGEMVKRLQNQSDALTAGLLYMSDHGESLGENGIYLHGMPYGLAPLEQKTVPALVWLSNDYKQERMVDGNCLQNSQSVALSQDYLSHSLLGLMDIETQVYQPSLDFFAPCRNRWARAHAGVEHSHT